MAPIPTGTLTTTESGVDLVLERRFRLPVAEVWAHLTESERTARWFASRAGEGPVISYKMTFEEGTPEGEMRVDACEPPGRLAVSTADEHGGWRLEALVREEVEETVLAFVHHLADAAGVGSIGPGWEYYLDQFAVALRGTPQVEFDAYYPAQQRYYEDAAARLA